MCYSERTASELKYYNSFVVFNQTIISPALVRYAKVVAHSAVMCLMGYLLSDIQCALVELVLNTSLYQDEFVDEINNPKVLTVNKEIQILILFC